MSNLGAANTYRTPPASNPLSGRTGNLTIAALAGVYAAVPDYITGKFARRATRSGLLAAMAGVLIAAEASPFVDTDGDGESDLKEAVDAVLDTSADTLESDGLNPIATYAVLGGSLAAIAGVSAWLDGKAQTLATNWLRNRGAKKPHTIYALGYAAATYGLLELSDRFDVAAETGDAGN